MYSLHGNFFWENNMKIKKTDLKKKINILQEAIYSKCLDCTCCQPKEILLCEIQGCPLWEFRPIEKKGLQILIKRLKEKNPKFYG